MFKLECTEDALCKFALEHYSGRKWKYTKIFRRNDMLTVTGYNSTEELVSDGVEVPESLRITAQEG